MSGQPQEGIIWRMGVSRRVRTAYRPDRLPHAHAPSTGQWPLIDQAISFDEHVLACVLSRALDEIDVGEATATQATGLSLADLRDVLTDRFPHAPISAFALEEASDVEPEMEEKLLRDLLLMQARPGDPASARFAKIIARRAMRDDHLWQDLGLFNRAELSRLLATHFPALAAGNTRNMKWKKYLYRMLCEAEGFSICTAPSCRQCTDFESCFGSEEDESHLARIRNDIDLDEEASSGVTRAPALDPALLLERG
ncbi:nitrogen fixation protein NifQ [Mesorhizobium sp. SARCC-RB16n]|uniref:nitrogen fixation protein NifQ n=1 Tax=Mesorhizobium sp. SARCC-RB16n TaxID=2116687 RepID=UPI00122F0E18|nr:nitrogen fixation protein NifQ [Mesorhizobium sp. SARCC-RB16n]KAA3448395.1 nitrogen fixation protein NifQ [Mesorhizobium sp. SARCC-RB16n]